MAPLKSIIVAFLLAYSAWGQTTTRTFHLTTLTTLPGSNEIATVLRTLGVRNIVADISSHTITVSGTDAELGLAAWLVEHFDSEQPQTATAQYAFPGSPDDTVRIFYLVNVPAQSILNEMVTSLRVTADIQRIFTCTPQNAIAMRTTAAKAQLAEWLIQQLDVPADAHPSGERYGFAGPGGPGEVVEVAFLKYPRTQAGLNEAVTAIRSVANIRYIFTRSSPQGMVFRGSVDQVQSAERILQEIDVQ
jgi:hypothetical protein